MARLRSFHGKKKHQNGKRAEVWVPQPRSCRDKPRMRNVGLQDSPVKRKKTLVLDQKAATLECVRVFYYVFHMFPHEILEMPWFLRVSSIVVACFFGDANAGPFSMLQSISEASTLCQVAPRWAGRKRPVCLASDLESHLFKVSHFFARTTL